MTSKTCKIIGLKEFEDLKKVLIKRTPHIFEKTNLAPSYLELNVLLFRKL